MSQIPMVVHRFPTFKELPLDTWEYGVNARAPLGAGALPIICVSGFAIVLCVLLACVHAKYRQRQAEQANASWHLLGPAVLLLELSHVACVVIGLAFYHDQRVADSPSMRKYGPMLGGWFNGLHTLFVLAACKTALWELTAPAIFRLYDNIRWVSLAFDILLFFLISGSLFATSFEHDLCHDWYDRWRYFCFPNAIDNVLAHVVNTQISRGLQIFIFLEYGNVLLSSVAAGSWARTHGLPSPVADVMIFIISPLLALQMFACIATMAVGLHIDFSSKALVYYVSLPYWILQFVVITALMWTFQTRPLWDFRGISDPESAGKQLSLAESLTFYSPQPTIAPPRPLAVALPRVQPAGPPSVAPARPRLRIITRQSLPPVAEPPAYQYQRVAPAESEWSVSA